MRQKGFAPIIILLVIFALGLLGYLAFTKGYLSVNLPKPSASVVPTVIPGPSNTPDPTANWKTYTNTDVGFTFKYPPDVVFTQKQDANNLQIYTSSTKISSLTNDYPGTNKTYVENDQPKLLKGEYGLDVGMGKNYLSKIINVEGVYIKNYISLTGLDCLEIHFNRSLYFYKNGYVVSIILIGPKDNIISENPQYFSIDKDCDPNTKTWVYEKINAFIQNLDMGNTSGSLKDWYLTFDQILSTFKFTQ